MLSPLAKIEIRGCDISHLNIESSATLGIVNSTFDPSWIVGCKDTVEWENPHNVTCQGYSDRGWCTNGGVSTPAWENMGSAFNFPQENCCVCGKQSSLPALKAPGQCSTDQLCDPRSLCETSRTGGVECSCERDDVPGLATAPGTFPDGRLCKQATSTDLSIQSPVTRGWQSCINRTRSPGHGHLLHWYSAGMLRFRHN